MRDTVAALRQAEGNRRLKSHRLRWDNAARQSGNSVKLHQVLNTNGALPHSGTFTSSGGDIVIMASGSGFNVSGADQLIGMTIKLDGALKGYSRMFTNEASSHKAFVPAFLVVTGVTAGAHTILLEQWSETASDGNDFFFVTVLER